MDLEIRLLGPVEVWYRTEPVNLGHLRQRAVFAILAAEAGQPVSTDRLEYRLWGDNPPAQARKTLHSYLTRLRRSLAHVDEVAILRDASGYRLAAPLQCIDLQRFLSLSDAARNSGGETAARYWESALDLWKGEAFSDVDSPWLDAMRREWNLRRFTAELDHNDTRIALGDHAALLPRLDAQTKKHPLDERLAAQFMEALHRSGRSADALEHHRRLRARMVDRLGQEPGPELRALYRRILSDGPPDPDISAVSSPTPVPRLLPMPPAGFIGREPELTVLDDCLSGETSSVHVVSGPGGSGKTWLALHWAHRHRERFPDGQLYVNLRGFDPVAEPSGVGTVLADFLEALGVPESALPKTTRMRTNLFRSLTAERRLLVVLDNARDAAQVDPLLPGAGGCVTLVTSRHQLPALMTGHGARHTTLPGFAPAEARKILEHHVGAEALRAESSAVDALIARCDGVGLAIGIVAARAALQAERPLASIVDELQDDTTRLTAMETGDLSVGMRAVLAGSLRALSNAARTVFTATGLVPVSRWSKGALAGLTGMPLPRLTTAVIELEQAHLLEANRDDRYGMHDLTRLYATEQAEHQVPDDDKAAALDRFIDHYVRTAEHCRTVVFPGSHDIGLDAPVPGSEPMRPTDTDQAREWLRLETANLTAVQRIAGQRDRNACFDLAEIVLPYLLQYGHYDLVIATGTAAIDSGRRADRPDEQAYVRALMLGAFTHLGRQAEALRARTEAGELIARCDETPLRSIIHSMSAYLANRFGDHRTAVQEYHRALDVFRQRGNQRGEARALNNIGFSYALLGDYDRAAEHSREGLALARELHAVDQEVAALDSLGYIAHRRGDPGEAVRWYRQALDRRRQDGGSVPHPRDSDIWDHLGDAHQALDDAESAVRAWKRAVAIYQQHYQYEDAEPALAKIAAAEAGPR